MEGNYHIGGTEDCKRAGRWHCEPTCMDCWNLYSIYGSYCLLKHSYIAPFLPVVLFSDLLSILQVYLLS